MRKTKKTRKAESLSKYLRRMRITKSLSQQDIADALGCRPQFVANWEAERCRPPLNSLYKITDLLGVSKMEILEVLTNEHRRIWEKALKIG